MKPKKPQECWMPMQERSKKLMIYDADRTRVGCLFNIKDFYNGGVIPVKVQLIPVIKKRGKR